MPKDEFDFDDPLELNGVALCTDEDTSRDMAECFIEEYMRLGYTHKHLLAFFRNPHYLGMNMVLENKGEAFVKDVIREVFARWGKQIEWPKVAPASGEHASHANNGHHNSAPAEQSIPVDEKLTDPMGNPLPKLNI